MKVKNTMQPAKLLFFILIVLISVSTLSLEQHQQAEGIECIEGEIAVADMVCVKPADPNFTIPEPRTSIIDKCEVTDEGKKECKKGSLTNGTFSFKTCDENGKCRNVVVKDESTTGLTTSGPNIEFKFPFW